jgi:transposase
MASEPEFIEQLKQQLAAPLFAAVSSKLESYQSRLQHAELKIRVLEERLRLLRIAKYGAGSEKLSDAQLELLELEPGVSQVEVQAESQREVLSGAEKARRRHPGRQELPSHLRRVERVVACTLEQKVCGSCGKKRW